MTEIEIYIYLALGFAGLFIAFLLNKKIYSKTWFRKYIPISLILIITGLILKNYFKSEYYKLMVVPVMFIYIIKLIQFIYGLFNEKYYINIRGFEDREVDAPSMDTLISFLLIGIYVGLFLIL